MIELPARPPAPQRLAPIRREELARVRKIAAGQDPSSDEIGDRYAGPGDPPAFKAILWRAQHHKCCYCEHQEQLKRRDAEHFRPKAASRGADGRGGPGYWWLAWTWDNLLFACDNCNRTKGVWFPLEHGSTPLQPEMQPPGGERPLLIDPARESAVPHIRYRWYAAKERWVPVPRRGSERGKWTIEKVGLDRPGLLDLYTSHVNNVVAPAIRAINAATGGGEVELRRVWKRRLGRLFHPPMPFQALSLDVLSDRFDEAFRNDWGVNLPSL